MAFIKDSFSSFGLGLLYPFILYLFPTILRIIALRSNKSNLSKPNTDRTCFKLIKIKKLNENCKSILRKINLKKDIKFNIKSHNINRVKFPKIVSLYSSNSNIKLKPIISKIKSELN